MTNNKLSGVSAIMSLVGTVLMVSAVTLLGDLDIAAKVFAVGFGSNIAGGLIFITGLITGGVSSSTGSKGSSNEKVA